MVDRDCQELTVGYDISEKAKLEGGPAKLTFEANLWQRGLFHRDGDEGLSVSVELVGHRPQKCLAPAVWMCRDLDCHRCRSLAALSDFGERALLEVKLTTLSARRIQTDHVCHRPALHMWVVMGRLHEAPQSS